MPLCRPLSWASRHAPLAPLPALPRTPGTQRSRSPHGPARRVSCFGGEAGGGCQAGVAAGAGPSRPGAGRALCGPPPHMLEQQVPLPGNSGHTCLHGQGGSWDGDSRSPWWVNAGRPPGPASPGGTRRAWHHVRLRPRRPLPRERSARIRAPSGLRWEALPAEPGPAPGPSPHSRPECPETSGRTQQGGVRPRPLLSQPVSPQVNSENVVKVGHRQVVNMIRQGGNHLVLKVVTVTRSLDPDDTTRKKGGCPPRPPPAVTPRAGPHLLREPAERPGGRLGGGCGAGPDSGGLAPVRPTVHGAHCLQSWLPPGRRQGEPQAGPMHPRSPAGMELGTRIVLPAALHSHPPH